VNTVTTNFTTLRTLQRQLAELKGMEAQVGLFKDTAGRSADKGRIADNPSLGFEHEFGNFPNRLPERSFLRMPLFLHLGPTMLTNGLDWLWMLRNFGARRMLGRLGVMAEEIIQEAFATRGWGAWPELRPATIRRKGSTAILIESAQLRKAVSSRVI